MISDIDRKQAMNAIILTQCFGLVSYLCFANGLMFNYLTYLEYSEQSMVIFLRLPSIIAMFTTLPLAYLSDMKGKSKLGQVGNLIQAIGLACLCSAAYISGLKTLAVVGGILLFSIGVSLVNSSWFALLDPIITPAQRGPFFAKLRTIWQLFGVIFTFVAQFTLEAKGDTILAPLLMVVVGFSIIRMYFYAKIPELEQKEKKPEEVKSSFKDEFKKVTANKEYFRYCVFMLLFPLGTSSLTLIYNLYEKAYLNFDSPDIVLMGNLAMIGGIVGFAVGALALKKLGEKLLFLYCTCCTGLCAFAFPFHYLFEWIPINVYAGTLTFCTGLSMASMSIGITSLMLHLLPQENKSMSTSMFITSQELGTAMGAGLLSLLITFFKGNREVGGFQANVYSISLIVIAVCLPLGVWMYTRTIKEDSKSKDLL